MDEELRRLERLAASGDPQARAAIDERWRRKGLGWWGEPLSEGVSRAEPRQHYRFSEYGNVEMLFLRQGPKLVAIIPAIPSYPKEKPPAPFEEVYAAALLANGYEWALVDLDPAPTVSDVSLGGLAEWTERFREAGGRLGCFGGRGNLPGLLQMINFVELLGWGATREEALEWLRT